jgi:aspartate/methionine/tyrosine aminotransferase
MPRFPHFSERVQKITGSVFETFRSKMISQGDALIKLHIGDTNWLAKYDLPLPDDIDDRYPGFNQYCDTFGIQQFRQLLAAKLQQDNGIAADEQHILVTAGSTNALSASTMTLVNPGEAVMILTPAWPFFFGMVDVAGGAGIQVPFYTELFKNPQLDIVDTLERYLTPETVALYINTPNNPSGKVMNAEQLEQVAQFARRHDLWVISDEAYDGLTFDGLQHISVATFPDMFERTVSIFTFSKTFMFAGLRLGYAVCAGEVVSQVNKIMVHQL